MIFLAEESGGFGSLFTSLGLNVQSLLLNTAAFLVVVYVLGRFVYPSLIKALDAKKDELEAAVRLENEARTALNEAKDQASSVVEEARASAEEILSSAKTDATDQIEAARKKAAEQGERLLAEAREQMERDVLNARRELKSETAKLVASATEAVLNEKLDGDHDRTLIARSLGDR